MLLLAKHPTLGQQTRNSPTWLTSNQSDTENKQSGLLKIGKPAQKGNVNRLLRASAPVSAPVTSAAFGFSVDLFCSEIESVRGHRELSKLPPPKVRWGQQGEPGLDKYPLATPLPTRTEG